MAIHQIRTSGCASVSLQGALRCSPTGDQHITDPCQYRHRAELIRDGIISQSAVSTLLLLAVTNLQTAEQENADHVANGASGEHVPARVQLKRPVSGESSTAAHSCLAAAANHSGPSQLAVPTDYTDTQAQANKNGAQLSVFDPPASGGLSTPGLNAAPELGPSDDTATLEITAVPSDVAKPTAVDVDDVEEEVIPSGKDKGKDKGVPVNNSTSGTDSIGDEQNASTPASQAVSTTAIPMAEGSGTPVCHSASAAMSAAISAESSTATQPQPSVDDAAGASVGQAAAADLIPAVVPLIAPAAVPTVSPAIASAVAPVIAPTVAIAPGITNQPNPGSEGIAQLMAGMNQIMGLLQAHGTTLAALGTSSQAHGNLLQQQADQLRQLQAGLVSVHSSWPSAEAV